MAQMYSGVNSTKRGRTKQCFRHFRGSEIWENGENGFHYKTKFFPFVAGEWTKTNLVGTATFEPFGLHSGGARLDSGAATIQHGGQLQLGGGTAAAGTITPQSSCLIHLHLLLRLTTISTFPKFFHGLSTANAASLSSGALNGTNMIGFAMTGTDGHIDLVSRVAGVTYASPALDLHTIVDDEWVKLDLLIKDLKKAIPYVNDVEQAASKWLPAEAIPTAIMTPTLAFQNGGAVRSVCDLLEYEVGVNDAVDYF
jgi:hypothetical protein